jgi:hypothetical protein
VCVCRPHATPHPAGRRWERAHPSLSNSLTAAVRPIAAERSSASTWREAGLSEATSQRRTCSKNRRDEFVSAGLGRASSNLVPHGRVHHRLRAVQDALAQVGVEGREAIARLRLLARLLQLLLFLPDAQVVELAHPLLVLGNGVLGGGFLEPGLHSGLCVHPPNMAQALSRSKPPKAAARLVLEASAEWASPFSRGLWGRDVLLHPTGNREL